MVYGGFDRLGLNKGLNKCQLRSTRDLPPPAGQMTSLQVFLPHHDRLSPQTHKYKLKLFNHNNEL